MKSLFPFAVGCATVLGATAPLQPIAIFLRQNVAAQRDRTGQVNSSGGPTARPVLYLN